jgi:acyl-CoA dehydrogenase
MWSFSTDSDYQAKLDWADAFVRGEVEPLDLAFPGRHYHRPANAIRSVINPLKQRVREAGLWATHLGPELG